MPAPRDRVAPQRAVTTRRTQVRAALSRLRKSDLQFVPWVVLGALVLTPGLVIENWQFVGLVLSVVTAGAAYLRSPTAGVVVVVALWTFAPLVRRLLDYYVATSTGPDVLSLAPFFATLVVGALAFGRGQPSRVALTVLGCVWAGFLWGVPLGVDDPFALLFGLFSYIAGSMGVLIGYADWKHGRLTLERVLLVLLPVVAAYGIYQYLVPFLPAFDDLWLRTEAPISTGRKESGDFRAFSVMNSPGLLAGVLAVFSLMLITGRRITPWRVLAGALAMGGLAFTQVRSAWLAMAAALVVLAPISRGGVLARIGLLLVVLGGMYLAVGGSDAGQAVVDRATTVADAGEDGSVRARIQAITEFGPQALVQPLGAGLGSAGQAARVSVKGQPPFVDNGYLTIMWQVGLLGSLLIMGGILGGAIYGTRQLNRYRRAERFPLLAILVVTAVMHLAGDSLFGLPAVMFWYCLGALMASREDPECVALIERAKAQRTAEPTPRPPMGVRAPARAGTVTRASRP